MATVFQTNFMGGGPLNPCQALAGDTASLIYWEYDNLTVTLTINSLLRAMSVDFGDGTVVPTTPGTAVVANTYAVMGLYLITVSTVEQGDIIFQIHVPDTYSNCNPGSAPPPPPTGGAWYQGVGVWTDQTTSWAAYTQPALV